MHYWNNVLSKLTMSLCRSSGGVVVKLLACGKKRSGARFTVLPLRCQKLGISCFQCKIQKNWCTVAVAPTIEHHGGHSRTPTNQRWDQVPGRSRDIADISLKQRKSPKQPTNQPIDVVVVIPSTLLQQPVLARVTTYYCLKGFLYRPLSRLQIASTNRVAVLTSCDGILWVQGIPNVKKRQRESIEIAYYRLNKGCRRDKFVIRSVTDVLRTRSRFVKCVGGSACGFTPHKFYKPTLARSTSETDLITYKIFLSDKFKSFWFIPEGWCRIWKMFRKRYLKNSKEL